MKKRILVFAMALLTLLAVPTLPVSADNLGTALHGIVNCAKAGGSACGEDWGGIRATVRVQDNVLQPFGGHSVTGLYLVAKGGRVGYQTEQDLCDNCDWIEVGYERTRFSLIYGNTRFFFQAVNNGVIVSESFAPFPSQGTGEYLLELARDPADLFYVTGRYRPEVGGPSTWVTIGQYHPSPWWKGSVRTAVESYWQSPGSYDRVSPHHKYVIVQRSTDWVLMAANYANGAQTKTTLDNITCYSNVWVGGSGNTGDTLNYPLVC